MSDWPAMMSTEVKRRYRNSKRDRDGNLTRMRTRHEWQTVPITQPAPTGAGEEQEQ